MPSRASAKRTLEEIAAAEDSSDDDYDDKAASVSKSRSKKAHNRSKPARKRPRRTYGSGSEDEDNDEDDSLLSGSSGESDKEEEPVEMNEHGRPLRKAAKARKTYEESDPDDDEMLGGQTSGSGEEEIKPPSRSKNTRRKLIVKLKTGTPRTTPAPTTRNLRKRSGSHSSKQPPTPTDAGARGTRRSSRLSGDDEETLVGLSNSGKHAEVVRAGSREPEVPVRHSKGGKGLKHPSNSTIPEASQEDSNRDNPEEVLEIKASQHEIMESDPQTQGEAGDDMPRILSDIQDAAKESSGEEEIEDEARVVPESQDLGEEAEQQDDDDDDPISHVRTTRASKRKAQSPIEEPDKSSGRLRSRNLRSQASKQPSRSSQRKGNEESSDFEPDVEQEKEDEMSGSEESEGSPEKPQDEYESSNSRRSRLRRGKRTASRQSPVSDEEENLAEELAELKSGSRKRKPRSHEIVYEPRRTRGPRGNVDYRLLRPELNLPIEEAEEDPAPTPSKRRGGGGGGGGSGWQRSLFSTYGPFGGAGGPAPILGGPGGIGAAGGVDSDSSDEEGMQRPKPVGGTVGMTPTSAFGPGFPGFPAAQALNADAVQGTTGTPANLGKIKDKQALADADPLGVDQNVTFEGVGGLQGHIDQLKEMVALPLLYPEIFMRFKITPPRGVLFHGPPGTGKTLLARALASSVSSQGKKVTFYMRKGADALSKWVGEAEKQLRMLFEEARRTQPSIIFFDEIDGLAPVRSSKQEQIHASIVSTLLALMDGMDGRGQVVVIGATNRPDSVDPALRRPGRFDREFYFPLPSREARRAILDIHTKGWNPPLDPTVKDELAELTKGYGGADLRALCTEAALNAVQRRYPQIYKSQEKLLIDPKTIEVIPKDFMISLKKMVPSSERSASSGASPLPESVEPLLRKPLDLLERIVAEIVPLQKKTTALEEAQYEDAAETGFGREKLQQAFNDSRVFRPRLLVRGPIGMGQQYLAAALLHHFEGLHVQSFELSVLLGDATSSSEATIVRLFSEVKTHKPGVIYIPNFQTWYSTLGHQVVLTFLGLLRSLHPTDPILVLGILEVEKDMEIDEDIIKQFFGYSKRNSFTLSHPDESARRKYFEPLMRYVAMTPEEFPDPLNRKKRVVEELKPAPPEEPKPPPPPTKAELKAQKRRDRHTLNMLKIQLQPIMDQIRTKHRKFRTGVIEEHQIRYLFDEADPGTVSSDLHTELLARASFRPYEIGKDAYGEPGLVETGTGKFFYNLDTVTIEKRLSNGYYKRPKDFLADIKRLAKDARTIDDQDRLLKANELATNVETDIYNIEEQQPMFTAECERVYQRELIREKEAIEKAKKSAAEAGSMRPPPVISNVPHGGASEPSSMGPSTGPITLGEPVNDKRMLFRNAVPITPSRPSHSSAATNGVPAATAGGLDLNGSVSHKADAEGDTNMTNSESRPNPNQHSNERTSAETQKTHTTSSSSFGPSAQPRPPHSWTAPSQQMRQASGMSAPLSQKSTVTPMAAGSQAADYHNSASTTQTTSAKKNSGSTGEKISSQETGPNLYMYDYTRPAESQGTQIPDTQPETQNSHRPISSNSQQSHSLQALDVAPPRNRSASISALLNDEQAEPISNSTTKRHTTTNHDVTSANSHSVNNAEDKSTTNNPNSALAIDHSFVTSLHDDVSSRTTGCSVEQLEQVNSVLMDTVWRTRHEWNRSVVALAVASAFNKVLEDMEDCGWEFGPSSWGRQH